MTTTCLVQALGTIELYFYGELDERVRRETEEHLSACAECRRALGELEVIRAALASRPDVSAPAGGDWSAFMASLEDSIRRDPRSGDLSDASRARPDDRPRRYVAYIAMAALLVLVSGSVAHVIRTRPAVEPAPLAGESTPAGRAAANWSEDAAFASLSEQHFERSKLVVLGLANRDAARGQDAEWQYERELASALLADTRLYRLTAEDRGLKQLARIMGDLELVLLQASLSGDSRPDTLAQIQSLIRKRDLVTRMNVMASAGM